MKNKINFQIVISIVNFRKKLCDFRYNFLVCVGLLLYICPKIKERKVDTSNVKLKF